MEIVEINVEIEVLTGLRIGGEKETFEVGGLDNPVIKVVYDEDKKFPIIPGSSLKGKMRYLLEKKYNIPSKNGKPIDEPNEELNAEQKRIIELFGSSDGVKLIFSDLLPTKETVEKWIKIKERELSEDYGTETKTENRINRITGKAEDPRSMERIIKGSKFRGVITLVYRDSDEKNKNLESDLTFLKEGAELVAKTYLGGCGTRGYGRVKIDLKLEALNLSYTAKPEYIE